jgi:DNA segregation ATPase FtsK/SpoIIIE, S-DNA-T family
MSLWADMKARYKITKAFRAGSIYMTISSGENEKKIFPKIHSIQPTDHSIEYVFTLPTGLNPDLLKKNYFAFEQVFGQNILLDGEVKKFVLTVHKGSLKKELIYDYDTIKHAITGLKMPIVCGLDRNGKWIVYDAITEPNALISGEPGSGKSTQLRSILTTLIKYKSPDELHMYLGDLKMSEFHLFKGVQHVKNVAVFPDELERMLTHVYNEMLKRSKLLNSTGVMHVDQLPKAKKVPYILLAIDEVVMVMDNKDIKKMLVQIDSLGRALGIYNLLSLQRPSHDILDTKVRSLLTVRMGFRTTDLSNSKMIGTPGSEKIKRETPGRFFLKRDTLEEIQAPYLTDSKAKKLLEPYKSTEVQKPNTGDSVESKKVITEEEVFNDVNWKG